MHVTRNIILNKHLLSRRSDVKTKRSVMQTVIFHPGHKQPSNNKLSWPISLTQQGTFKFSGVIDLSMTCMSLSKIIPQVLYGWISGIRPGNGRPGMLLSAENSVAVRAVSSIAFSCENVWISRSWHWQMGTTQSRNYILVVNVDYCSTTYMKECYVVKSDTFPNHITSTSRRSFVFNVDVTHVDGRQRFLKWKCDTS